MTETNSKIGKTYLTNEFQSGKKVIVKSIAEQHILEDIGFIPSLKDWFKEMRPNLWMESTKLRTKKMNLA